ncbi:MULTISPECIES: methionine ABC transporter permease [Paenibacillus]|uniref:methionine ABC transporter permease n=1 Tax=Paenibacillus TaxID=44249 RepID=UPI000B7C9937|nr:MULTISPECIES: methionine ABC transporter permease [Paenibacillus]OXL85344.1 metal ABC transporter permease [Paenibacillus sp. SSG-1]UYO06951.1 ABC transporter permease [Paenibacillus sp. PSB04]GIO64616.1 D-methionine ABC transporter [Paenibacillus cineris]
MWGLDFSSVDWNEIGVATLDTLKMLGASAVFTFILGLPIGILLFMASRSTTGWVRAVYAVISFIVNILRSVPFIILIVALIPVTKAIVGVTFGVLGTIPPLVIAAAPFFARLVETSLREVDRGVIEAAHSMGASTWQVITRVLLPEARPGLLAGITITVVTLVSYTAMSGMVGGGGLGDLAIRYGYYRYETTVMIISVIFMIVLVQLLQMAGDRLVRHFTRK